MAVEEPCAPVYRPELTLSEQGGYLEKRRLFLQSYHFSRKRTPVERVRRSLVRARRFVFVRLRAARSLPRQLLSRLRYGWSPRLLWSRLRCGRRSFHHLVIRPAHPPRRSSNSSSSSSNCWSW